MRLNNDYYPAILLSLLVLLLLSCQPQSRGFVLPKGSVEKGEALFTELHCNDCHSIGDIAWAGSKSSGSPHIPLGGNVNTQKSYGELVTSVINPSHKISKVYQDRLGVTIMEGRSRMEQYNYNEAMTVQELIDVVAFLQSEYKVVTPESAYTTH